VRIAIIADIHGNLVALEAVLRSIESDRVDDIICLGDVAATGPHPHEVVQRLQALGCRCVMGNADAELLETIPDVTADEPRWLAIDRWCADLLTDDDRAYLRSFAPTHRLTLEGNRSLLAYHGSPRSFDDEIRVATPEDELGALLSAQPASVYAGGHTHEPFVRPIGTALVLNPGSIGLRPPNASYAIVSTSGAEVRVELRFVPLHADEVVRAAQGSGMPESAWWSSFWQ
jgi:predicted phosphodiesterase